MGGDVVSGAGLDVVHHGGEQVLRRGGVAGRDGVADAAPVTRVFPRRICSAVSVGGRPGTSLAFNASWPLLRTPASQPYTVVRCIPNAAATFSGCSPAATGSNARNRSRSSGA